MNGSWPDRQRRRIGIGILTLAGSWLLWSLTPGLPVLRAPRARAEVRQAGLDLFVHEWQPHDPLAHGDGLGPVFNARSCVACHFQGGVGGGGGPKENVVAFEALPTPGRPVVQTGLVHKFAVEERYSERALVLQALFPTVPNGLEVKGVCFSERHDFNPVRTQSLNSIALFGAGWIDRLSDEDDHPPENAAIGGGDRQGAGRGTSQAFPRAGPGSCPTAGLASSAGRRSSPRSRSSSPPPAPTRSAWAPPTWPRRSRWWWGTQPLPRRSPPTWTRPSSVPWWPSSTTLPRPQEVVPDRPPRARRRSSRARRSSRRIGCAACHTPDLGGVTGVYSDFLLHRIVDSRKNYTRDPRRPPAAGPSPSRGVEDGRPCGASPTVLPTSMTAAPRPWMRRSSATKAMPRP